MSFRLHGYGELRPTRNLSSVAPQSQTMPRDKLFCLVSGRGGALRLPVRSAGMTKFPSNHFYQNLELRGQGAMPSAQISNVAELMGAERRVKEVSALIEGERQIIEESEQRGYDATSAKILFESLLVSLSLYVQARDRLRDMLTEQAA